MAGTNVQVPQIPKAVFGRFSLSVRSQRNGKTAFGCKAAAQGKPNAVLSKAPKARPYVSPGQATEGRVARGESV
jgi:hypothetical protein